MLEVLACACGGTLRVISTIEEGPAALQILDHLGLPSAAEAPAPARVNQGDLFTTGPPHDDEPRAVLPADDWDQRTASDVA